MDSVKCTNTSHVTVKALIDDTAIIDSMKCMKTERRTIEVATLQPAAACVECNV